MNNYKYDEVSKELKKLINAIMDLGWIKASYNKFSSVGITFEQLLQKPIENFEIPDFNGIEIKTSGLGEFGYMTLFNAPPF